MTREVQGDDEQMTRFELLEAADRPCFCSGGFVCTAHLAMKELEGRDDAEPATPAKAKRRKGKSPTARTLDECRKRGWPAQVVERPWNPHTKKTLDLFGVIDLIAIVPADPDDVSAQLLEPAAIMGIQATTGSNHASRRTKILAEPLAKQWVDAGGRLELWTWSLRMVGKAKRWTLRVETYAEMVAGASEGV